MAQAGTTARGSEPSTQIGGETQRLVGSSTARLEQALNAEFERGFVGRLRDNGEMRLTVHGNDLGEMELRVAVRESAVHASIATQNDEARQLLTSQRGDLENALQRYNLRLDSFTVDVGNRDGRSLLHDDSHERGLNAAGQSGSMGPVNGQAAQGERHQSQDGSESGLSIRV
jgi:flagellar hook-length control protein FliK